MVVPYDDPRVPEMSGLQVRVGAVLGVADPVIFQRDSFARRFMRAIATTPVLVDIVAEVQHRVEIIAFRETAIGVEIPAGIGRTRNHSEAGALGRSRRRGPGAPDRRNAVHRPEAIIEGGAVRQPGRIELDRPIQRRIGRFPAGRDPIGEVRVACHLPVYRDGLVPLGRYARPEDHGIGERIPTRHAMRKERLRAGFPLVGILGERLGRIATAGQRSGRR